MKDDKTQRLRQKGQWSFIIKYGVLGWGIGTSLLVSIATPLFPWVEYTFIRLLAITLPTCCLSGSLFGYLMWRVLVGYDSNANAEQDAAEKSATAGEPE